jgi:pilus assembly protein Flp/PilA
MLRQLKHLKENESGQGLVEYALILVLVGIIVIAVLLLLGPGIGAVFSEVADKLGANKGNGTGFSVTLRGDFNTNHNDASWFVTCNGVSKCQASVSCQFYQNSGPNGSTTAQHTAPDNKPYGDQASGNACFAANSASIKVIITVTGASDTTGTVPWDGVKPSITCNGGGPC